MSGQTQILPGMQWTTQVNNKTQGVGVCVCECVNQSEKKKEREASRHKNIILLRHKLINS